MITNGNLNIQNTGVKIWTCSLVGIYPALLSINRACYIVENICGIISTTAI